MKLTSFSSLLPLSLLMMMANLDVSSAQQDERSSFLRGGKHQQKQNSLIAAADDSTTRDLQYASCSFQGITRRHGQWLRGPTSTCYCSDGFWKGCVKNEDHECFKKLVVNVIDPSASGGCANSVCGEIIFSCSDEWYKNGLTMISYKITGLSPGKHGVHVHENAVGTGGQNTCASTGGHWNPESKNHGSNLDSQRHIGDLGNFLADKSGVAEGTLLARVPLKGELGILGRAVVVHQGTDDLGRGGDEGSRAVGNAGARPGCGTIKLA